MELLDFALSMEEDLRSYYQNQAKLNSGNSLHKVFTLLEKEEEKHTEILISYADHIFLPLEDNDILSEIQSIFHGMKDYHAEIKEMANQLDIYRFALEKEEESLRFYQDLMDKATTEEAKKVFGYLRKQEDTHCIILEELVKLVKRPEEWVESAEFGLREEY